MTKSAFRFGSFLVVSSDRPVWYRTLTKTLLVMKLTILLLTVAFLNVHAKTVGQSVTISGKELTLKQIFTDIKKQTGYVAFGNAELLRSGHKISLSVYKVSLREILDIILKNQPFTYEIEGKTISLSRINKPPLELPSGRPDLPVEAPPIRIRITDADGNALSGASVTNKKTKNTGVTDSDGLLSLNVALGDVIEITYIGFQSQSISIKNVSSILEVSLMRTNSALDEFVFKGYYYTSKRLSTGSVSKVSSNEIEKQPVVNLLSALQGRMAGVNIVQKTGIPGGGFKVEIRGINSLREAGNAPLYVVNGVPYISSSLTTLAAGPALEESPLNNINPAEIQSVEILKDADATAIYGSRGANGVVLITTKQGSVNGSRVTADIYAGFSKVGSKMDVLNTAEYLELRKEYYSNDGITSYPANAFDVNGVWDQKRDIDWQKVLIGNTASNLNGQAALSGGTANLNYRLGVGYNKETTVFPGDYSNRRGAANFSLNSKSVNKKFTTHSMLNYGNTETNLPRLDLTESALTLAPNAPELRDEKGKVNFENGTFNTNPLMYTDMSFKSKSNSIIGNTNLSYEMIPDLFLKVNLGFNSLRMRELKKIPQSAYPPANASFYQNITHFGNTSSNTWIIEPQINWKKDLGLGKLEFIIGSTFQDEMRESLYQNAAGFSSEDLMENISAAPANQISNSYTHTIYRYNALFGRVNFNIDDTWLLNITGRRDGSSRFGPGKQFGNFGALSMAWIFTNNKFFKENFRFLNFGKIRSGYGLTGSDQIGDYQYLETFTTTGQYLGVSGLAAARLLNSDYSWETNKKLELALELGFLQDKLALNFGWYQHRSSNQLVGTPLPPTTGFSTVQSNLPATVQNRGAEISLNINNVRLGAFTWNSFVNLTIPKNKLLAFPNIAGTFYNYMYTVGEPLSIFKAFRYNGLNSTTGLYEVEDYNKDGLYNDDDKRIDAFLGTKFYGGWNNSIKYKSFQLDFFFQFTKQNGRNYLANFAIPGAVVNYNQPVEVMKRWQQPGDVTTIQQISLKPAVLNAFSRFRNSDASVTDASFLKLRNIAFTYSLPVNFTEKLNIAKASAFVQTQNILTFTKYRGLDPESQGTTLPPLKTFVIGLKLVL